MIPPWAALKSAAKELCLLFHTRVWDWPEYPHLGRGSIGLRDSGHIFALLEGHAARK